MQLAVNDGIYHAMINAWKMQAIECMSGVLFGKAEAAEAAR